MRWTGTFVHVYLNNTSSGKEFVCAIYNADEQLVASGTQWTDNLATSFLTRYGGELGDPVSAKCVFNN